MTQANPYCERLRLRFNDHYDGDLSYFLARVVRRHLESCGDCREDYGLLEKTVESVRDRSSAKKRSGGRASTARRSTG